MRVRLQAIYIVLSLTIIVILSIFDLPSFTEEYLKKKAYDGLPADQVFLGDDYSYKREYKKSLFWYKKAIKNGGFRAQNEIIDMYLRIENRDAVLKKDNIHKLIDAYQKWAEAGDIEAQKIL